MRPVLFAEVSAIIVLFSGAFAPAEPRPGGTTVQLHELPKTWVPDPKPAPKDPRNFGRILPPADLKHSGPQKLPAGATPPLRPCPAPAGAGGIKESREFVEALWMAKGAVQAGQLDALGAAIDTMAATAISPQGLVTSEQFRDRLFEANGDDASLLASLEAQAATGCLSSEEVEDAQKRISELRDKLGKQ